MDKAREGTTWKGKYKNVAYEIVRWGYDYTGEFQTVWNFYLIISLNQVPEKYNPGQLWIKADLSEYGREFYRDSESEIISKIDWHGGCTWYSKVSGFDGGFKIIKVGCDYNHVWDMGKTYSLDDIKFDTAKAIDSFLKMVPEYGEAIK